MSYLKELKRVGIITLGCDKNTVDSEYIAGLLEDLGYEVVPLEDIELKEEFDAILVNTCGFILDAKKQSIDAIATLAEQKRLTGNPKRFFVYGCLTQRYPSEIWKKFPEIDGLVGVGQWDTLIKIIQDYELLRESKLCCLKKPQVQLNRYIRRKALSDYPYSFLKIADGCSHKCSFCAIPAIKGPYRSVPMEIILQEAEYLLSKGVRELNLVAQDISLYGRDIKQGYGLVDLLRALSQLKGDFWIRCLYTLPSGISKKLLQVIVNEAKIVHYLDIPIQHIDKKILKLMNRPRYNEDIFEQVKKIREVIPDIALRTTLILGFPGESYASFQQLLRAIEQIRFERLGAFIYSPEEGTLAEKLPRKVGKIIAERRYHILMETQAEISLEFNRSRVGREYKVLIEEFNVERGIWIGRSYAEAPEVDGIIWVQSPQELKVGEFYQVRITGAEVYDLYGEVVSKQNDTKIKGVS